MKQFLDQDIICNIKIDLKTSTLKLINFQWLVQCMSWLSQKEDSLISGWKDSGILESIGQ